MDPDKTSAVAERIPPKNIKQLQSFLGFCNHYRRFIKGFANISSPLHNLCSPKTQFIWSDSCNIAFNTLKAKLIEYPILRKPDFNRPFKLLTDASSTALGAILAQEDDDGNEFVICYASRILKAHEKHYSVTELECLAAVWAINYFRIYLYGFDFTLVTDHYALKWLLTLNNPNSRLTRWSIM